MGLVVKMPCGTGVLMQSIWGTRRGLALDSPTKPSLTTPSGQGRGLELGLVGAGRRDVCV